MKNFPFQPIILIVAAGLVSGALLFTPARAATQAALNTVFVSQDFNGATANLLADGWFASSNGSTTVMDADPSIWGGNASGYHTASVNGDRALGFYKSGNANAGYIRYTFVNTVGVASNLNGSFDMESTWQRFCGSGCTSGNNNLRTAGFQDNNDHGSADLSYRLNSGAYTGLRNLPTLSNGDVTDPAYLQTWLNDSQMDALSLAQRGLTFDMTSVTLQVCDTLELRWNAEGFNATTEKNMQTNIDNFVLNADFTPLAHPLVVVDDDWAGLPACSAVTVGSNTYRIGVEAFATIQSAVQKADPGAAVTILPGAYTEAVTITRAVTLAGPGNLPNVHLYLSADVNFTNLAVGQVTVNPGGIPQDGIDLTLSGGAVNLAPGTYSGSLTIHKPLTLQGAGVGITVIDGNNCGASTTCSGITLPPGTENVSIADLTITRYFRGIYRSSGSAASRNITIEDVESSNNASAGVHFEGSAPAYNITFTRLTANDNGATGLGVGRGIFMQSHYKENIVVQDGIFLRNRIAGIDLNDGPAVNADALRGFRITGNTVSGGSGANQGTDAGIAVLGAVSSASDTSVISNNSVTIYGRFGIEIKNCQGNGNGSGPGSLVIQNNTISLGGGSDLRDLAGIAVYERFSHPDRPTNGIVIANNHIEGIVQSNPASLSTGFGIVVGGTNQVVANNQIFNSTVGIQLQQGYNADQTDKNDAYFGRDKSAATSAVVISNVISNTVWVKATTGGNDAAFRLIAANGTVKGNSILTSTTAISQTNGTLVAYANNIANFAIGFAGNGGSANIRHNWWGTNDPTAARPTGLPDADWQYRLGARVTAWADGTNSTSLADSANGGTASLSNGSGTAVIVSHGRAASAAAAPFANGLTGHVNAMCSDFYDFFTAGSTSTAWQVEIPVDSSAGCMNNTLTPNVVYWIPDGAVYSSACSPSNNTTCWEGIPAGRISQVGQQLRISGLSSTELGSTPIVAGNTSGLNPTVVRLERLSATATTNQPWWIAGLLGAGLLALVFYRSRFTHWSRPSGER